MNALVSDFNCQIRDSIFQLSGIISIFADYIFHMIRFISLLAIVILLFDLGEVEKRSTVSKESTHTEMFISGGDQLIIIESDCYCTSFLLEDESDSDESASLNTVQTINIDGDIKFNSFFHQLETYLVSLILFEADSSPPATC